MSKKIRKTHIFLILFTLLASIYIVFTKPIKLGLDLKGGSYIKLKVDIEKVINEKLYNTKKEILSLAQKLNIPILKIDIKDNKIYIYPWETKDIKKLVEEIKKNYSKIYEISFDNQKIVLSFNPSYLITFKRNILEQELETIRNRVDSLGVSEPIITIEGNEYIVVELAGIKDPERAKKILKKVANLEFMEVIKEYPLNRPYPLFNLEKCKENINNTVCYLYNELKVKYANFTDIEILPGVKKIGQNKKIYISSLYVLKTPPILTGRYLEDAYPSKDQYGMPAVAFRLNAEGAKIFENYTASHIGKRLAIVLDKKVMSAPVIQSKISSQGQITGSFTLEEAQDLALVLKAGALPAPVKIVEENTVGPYLGKASIEAGFKAAVAGLILVLLFMLFYYKIFGLISDIALLLNCLFLYALLVILDAVLTLPGIAGFILTIGMSVDANVIIFERIKEELRKGRRLSSAIEFGFKKAWLTILDANITTLITALILFIFGTGPIRGFAITLSLGLICSLFTAVFVTKVLIDFIYKLNPKLLKI